MARYIPSAPPLLSPSTARPKNVGATILNAATNAAASGVASRIANAVGGVFAPAAPAAAPAVQSGFWSRVASWAPLAYLLPPIVTKGMELAAIRGQQRDELRERRLERTSAALNTQAFVVGDKATICDEDICEEVTFTERNGRLQARRHDGTILKNCRRVTDAGGKSKRVCTARDRTLTEQ